MSKRLVVTVDAGRMLTKEEQENLVQRIEDFFNTDEAHTILTFTLDPTEAVEVVDVTEEQDFSGLDQNSNTEAADGSIPGVYGV